MHKSINFPLKTFRHDFRPMFFNSGTFYKLRTEKKSYTFEKLSVSLGVIDENELERQLGNYEIRLCRLNE